MYGAYFGFSPASRQPTRVQERSEISAAGHLAFPDVAVFGTFAAGLEPHVYVGFMRCREDESSANLD